MIRGRHRKGAARLRYIFCIKGTASVTIQAIETLLPRRSPFGPRFAALDTLAAAKVTVALVRLGQGNLSRAKPVGEGCRKSGSTWGPGYRIYFGQDGACLVILLTGGTKRRQQRDIARAHALWQDCGRKARNVA